MLSIRFKPSNQIVRQLVNFRPFSPSANNYSKLLRPQQSNHKLLISTTKHVFYSSDQSKSGENKQKEEVPKTIQQKLKKAVAEYGSTVIVFHVTISLISLGTCYLIISSGIDVGKFLPIGDSDLGGVDSETVAKVATGAGTFAIAYGVHKLFAPVRIMITLTATPFIVRYLRSIGILRVK